MLRNAKVITFTDSEFLGENQQGGGGGVKITSSPPTQIRLHEITAVDRQSY